MREGRIVLFLASILSFRMLGLFLIYPIFAVYAVSYQFANPTTIGFALGIYGLSQALLQLPLSALSDRIGRKPIICLGLVIFAVGSVISAMATQIYLLILGRGLQGAGAIGSTLMAFCADLTSNKNRTKAMAVLGITIGISFALAIILGPLLNHWIHLSGIFWLTGAFAIIGLVILYTLPKQPVQVSPDRQQQISIKQHLFTKNLLALYVSILLAHAILTAIFSVIPLLFLQAHTASSVQWKIYLPVLLTACSLSMPLLILSERKERIKQALLLSFLLIGIATSLFSFFSATSYFYLIFSLFAFFTGFTLLEAILPSLISKLAPTEHRGSAMGIFSTFQFLGIFLGGAGAGIIRGHYGYNCLFKLITLLTTSWAIILFLNFSNLREQVPLNDERYC